tara:strand:- start:142 stop:849 length:708 start_codon:yes stop_codon:yes gene_type:complete
MINANENNVSVILTVWKRDTLEKQLIAINNQTANIDSIYVYQNESHIDIEHLKGKYTFKHIHSKDVNFKFHGRFTLPLLFDTKYTAIFDDDTIPNKKWLEHCINVCEAKNCIVGANGRKYHDTHFDPSHGNDSDVKCDIVGHCWFFKTEWVHYMWREKPPTYDNGEDIHFCATCKIYGNIDSYFPSQPMNNFDVWGDTQLHLGIDQHATWRKQHHDDVRYSLYEYWMKKGWEINT